jgi:hypothetical protein
MSTAPQFPRLVLVTGSGRSGTSSMAGVLKLLGLRIPAPEVPATRSNPKGHFEPQWVVDFQQRLLGRVHVKLTDARPQAFDDTARAGLRSAPQEQLREWLVPLLAEPSDVVIKDPRSTWFVPMWKQVAEHVKADLVTLTMLRHPAEVVGSKNTYYYRKESAERRRVGETSRVASWVNVALFGELATRGRPRSFVRYTDLLADWRKEVERVAEELDLGIRDGLPPDGVAAVEEFIDPDLRRVRVTWDDIEVPEALQELAEQVWVQLDRLVDAGGHDEVAEAALDAARTRYVQMYDDAFALASSSIDASVNAALKKQRRQLDAPAKQRQSPGPGQAGVERVRGTLRRYAGKARGAVAGLRRRSTS